LIGKLFNERYLIQEKLGSGGTAIVYKGQDTLLNRMVTIKILREEYASNEEFVRRFRREAQAVASLSHGNIVAVYDVGFEEYMHYIVMEFVEGQSLKEYIKQKGALPIQEAASVMTQVLDGISYAHEHGIIHRDIKPHNILLGKDGRAKVTDFGIAVGMTDMTQTYNTSSRIMGSVHYIAPEQVQGQPVTEKSDIYSAGVVFYEALTRQLPFTGDTPISIAMQHVQGELILPHQLNPKIPMSLSYVVMRAMRKNPETRYENAKEMREAIRSATDGLNSVYVSPSEENLHNARELDASLPGDEADKRASRDKGGLFSRVQPETNSRDYPRDRNAPRRRISFMGILFLLLLIAFVGTVIWAINYLRGIIDPSQTVDDKVIVPYVVGKDLAEAEAELLRLDLVPVVDARRNDDAPLNQVLQQSPPAESSVGAGRDVKLTVSDGPRRTEVPLVIGDSKMLAETKLKTKGLDFAYLEDEYNEDFLAGEIFRQDPIAGELAPGGTVVELTVSLGPEPVPTTAPDVLEKSFEEAAKLLEEAGLQVGSIKRVESSVYYAEIVMEQSTPGGSELSEGDSVDLTVSRGPGPAPVLRTTSVIFDVPNDGVSHRIYIVLNDSRGASEPYNEILAPGYPLQETISFLGEGTITVYMDDVIVKQYPLPVIE